VEVTDSWATLMRGVRDQLVGRHYSEFVLPEARAVAAELFDALRDNAEVRSEALLQRADGSTLAIEFRAVRVGETIQIHYRALPGWPAPPGWPPPPGRSVL
jgi:hypothetical protein